VEWQVKGVDRESKGYKKALQMLEEYRSKDVA
jgi:hypothetical protein